MSQMSEGSAGKLLQIFESIYLLDSEEEMMAQLELSGSGELQATDSVWIPICRALIKVSEAPSARWKIVSNCINKITFSDYEPGRRVVMAYISTVLLRTGTPVYANILEHFTVCNPSSSKAQFILACYKSCLER